jgi:hypothetical protein
MCHSQRGPRARKSSESNSTRENSDAKLDEVTLQRSDQLPPLPVTVSLTQRPASSEEVAERDAAIPERIGRYHVTGTLGRGGFGTVCLAVDVELQRAVALKVPHPGRAVTPEQVRVFRNEARILAKLDHPHIVPVYDIVNLDDGRCAVASKYVQGCSLRELIAQGPTPPITAAEIAAAMAEALSHAHLRGLVHRDIKPANILVDSSGRPLLADFGLAVQEEDQWRRSGEVSGSPAYMAPEQIDGRTHHLDGRTDIWSLGVVLYELLTGRRPFAGRTIRDLFDEITQRDPKPLRAIDDSLPVELERIVLKCLEKRIPDRHATAQDLAADLHRWLESERADEPSSQPLPATVSRVRAWHAMSAGMATLVVAVSVVITVLLVANFRFPGHEATDAGRAGTRTPPGVPVTVEGNVDVLVWKASEVGRGAGLSVLRQSREALPLRPGDTVRVHVSFNRPLYAYLAWIDFQGKTQPLYPWRNQDWEQLPRDQRPVQELALPERQGEGWEINSDFGREMIIMVARDEPLPPDFDWEGRLRGIPHAELAEVANPLVVLHPEPPRPPEERGLGPLRRIDDPAQRARAYLMEAFGEEATLTRAFSFATQGERRLPKLAEFRVQHRANVGGAAVDKGVIGRQSHQTSVNDDIQVEVDFEEPVHAFLIAFNPDGSEQLCWPEQSATPPPTSRRITFPANSNHGFGLTDGAGQQAFVIVASHAPLPAYETWRSELSIPRSRTDAVGVWRYSGGQIEWGESSLTRRLGPAQPLPGSRPLAEICQALERTSSQVVVEGIAFPVEPADNGR